jgi:hypothetical protein
MTRCESVRIGSTILSGVTPPRIPTLLPHSDQTLTEAEIEEQIRQRAYELYQGRGGVDGDATDDWLQARKEVLNHKANAATTSS